MEISELFWNSSLESIKKGYEDVNNKLICLICGQSFEKGIVYHDQGVFYESEKYIKKHINTEHDSVFDFLINMDKKYTGLTQTQKELLEYFYQGLSDQEIVKDKAGGSTSTVRSQRFSLREREKQAKVYLAILELLSDKNKEISKLVEIHRTATMVDERYVVTIQENENILKSQFGIDFKKKLVSMPKKEKNKIVVLRYVVSKFDESKKYIEKEVNEILKLFCDDYVTLRRYMIEYGFMDRTIDCKNYWVKK